MKNCARINGMIKSLLAAESEEKPHSIGFFFFAGYGNVTPLSEGGKIFCILYALLGIPLTLVLISALVERLLLPAGWFLGYLNSRLGHLYQPFHIRVFHLGIVGVGILLLFFLVPAAIFQVLEPEWDYLDSLYYCFISLTTIGLGDYIPGDSPDQKYRAMYKIFATGECVEVSV